MSSAGLSNMTDNVTDYSVNSVSLDGVQDQDETKWINTNFSKWLGYYKATPELKAAVDMRAVWTVGKGFKADARTEAILDHISGCGVDTFNSILKNAITLKRVGGDFFAEIIRDAETGTLINLKPLDPSTMQIVYNKKGVIIAYEQINKTSRSKPQRFSPKDIFHLCNKRIGNEIHGVSDIEPLEPIILANLETFFDIKTVAHRFNVPLRVVEVDTDDTAKIAELTTKYENLIKNKEVIFVPKGSVAITTEQGATNSIGNLITWRDHLRNYFFQALGLPQIILGGSQEFTESTAKIAYLAFQQSVEDEQLDIETQIWNQLQLRIELDFPATIQNELISDTNKDANQGMELQPGDTTMGAMV